MVLGSEDTANSLSAKIMSSSVEISLKWQMNEGKFRRVPFIYDRKSESNFENLVELIKSEEFVDDLQISWKGSFF